jgi:hypothetical protein
MKEFFPLLLTRQKAMQMLKCSRNTISKLTYNGEVRTFKTAGGHNRYFRDDLIKKNLTNKQNG